MASIARSTALRHAFKATPSVRATARLTAPAFRASAFTKPPTSRVAGFHASARKSILVPLPQRIDGTVNDPAPVPSAEPTHGAYHWSFERLLAAGLVPLTAAPFIGGSLSPVLDAVFCATLLTHSYIGFQASIIDYFPKWRTPKTRNALMWVLRISTVGVGVALYEFETNDIGLTGAVARIWNA